MIKLYKDLKLLKVIDVIKLDSAKVIYRMKDNLRQTEMNFSQNKSTFLSLLSATNVGKKYVSSPAMADQVPENIKIKTSIASFSREMKSNRLNNVYLVQF